MVAGPNLEAFRDAQNRLTQATGMEVLLLTPTETVWPSGVVLDPETTRPLNAWVEPVASGYVVASASASVAFRPLTTNRAGLKSTADRGPLGIKDQKTAVLILDRDDYPKASAATRAEVMGLSYKIEEIASDGLGSIQRYLVFLEQR